MPLIFNRRVNIFDTVATVLIVFWILHISACIYAYRDVYKQYNHIIVVPFMSLPSWIKTFVGQRTWTDFTLHYGVIWAVPDNYCNVMFTKYYGLKKIRADENFKWEDD